MTQPADVVLEGGGVKGTGLVGALTALEAATEPYVFQRVAGTSAGAIVASLLASGMTVAELKKIMMELDFSQFEDESRAFRHFKTFGEAFGLLFHDGLFRGDFLHQWIGDMLAQGGVHRWADLKQDDPESSLPADRRYKLVVVVSDVSRGRLLKLPWDYRDLLGVDPDIQPVADAVRASASIPFFFRPFSMNADRTVTQGHGHILCTDGGMLSDYPIDIFDRTDGRPARWPTLGVKLSAKKPIAESGYGDPDNAFDLAKALIATMENAHDRVHVDDRCYANRTIFVDTTGYKATDFHLTNDDKQKLFDSGLQAGQKFLQTWDWKKWQEECGSAG
jgi:NTE family protein